MRNIKDILDNIDPKKINKSMFGDIEYSIMEELGLDTYDTKIFEDNFKSQLKEFYIQKWYSTDTFVGLRAIYWNDEFLCLGYRGERKSDENFEWVSQEKYDLFFKYLKDLIIDKKTYIDVIDFDEAIDDYQIGFSSQLLRDEVIYKGELARVTNLRPNEDYLCNEIEIKTKEDLKVVPLSDIYIQNEGNR